MSSTKPSKSFVENIRAYFLTFADQTTVVLQLRDKDRSLSLENIERARILLGDLVPRCRSLGPFGTPDTLDGEQGLAYEMSFLSGTGLGEFLYRSISDVPLTVYGGIGALLGKCSTGVLPTTPGGNRLAVDDLLQRIRAARDDPTFKEYQSDISELMTHLDALERLPIAITNDDINFTNILINSDGSVSGLVDWEWFMEVPLGHDLGFLHFLRGKWNKDDGRYVPHANSGAIEDAFWTAFFAEARFHLTKESAADLETCMKLKAVDLYAFHGAGDLWPLGQLRMKLDYSIPVLADRATK